MNLFEITIDGDGEKILARDLETFGPLLRDHLGKASREAGRFMVERARGITREKDAIGATRSYLNGWKIETGGATADVLGALVNESPHGRWAELGRRPGKMPPKGALLPWLRHRGIPEKREFLVRRAIGRRGTKGAHVLDKLMERHGDEVLDMLEKAAIRVLESLQ